MHMAGVGSEVRASSKCILINKALKFVLNYEFLNLLLIHDHGG